MNYRYRPFCRIFCYTRNSQKPAITFLLCAYQMTFQRGAYPGRYACNNRTTLAYSWLDSRQNFNFASFPPRYSRTSTYDNCAHDSVYVRKPVLMDYKLLPYSPIQANVSFAYLGFMYSWIVIFQRRWGGGGSLGMCVINKKITHTCPYSWFRNIKQTRSAIFWNVVVIR